MDFKIVAREPDEFMIKVGNEAWAEERSPDYIYRAMLYIMPEDLTELVMAAMKALAVTHKYAEELCIAIDLGAEDIGGARPINDILRDLGPATVVSDKALAVLRAHPNGLKMMENE